VKPRTDLVVVSGSGCTRLAMELSRHLAVAFKPLITREFPDGELYVRVPQEVRGKRVALAICSGRRPNSALIEAVLAVKTLTRVGAREVILIMPYFPYARQDQEFSPGEAVSLSIVAELLEALGISALVTVDMHLHRVKSIGEVFRIKAINVSGMGELARYVSKNYGEGFTVVAPDEEARQWAEIFSKEIGADYLVLEKERKGDEDVRIRGEVSNVKKAVIVDDIISTGTTVAAAALTLREYGVEEIIAACTHGLFVAGAEAKIVSAGVKDIVATDSVVNQFARVSVAVPIANALIDITA